MSKYENIETVIDRFLDYVKTNKEISLSKVAAALAINSSQAERIALLLEQGGFVEIHYGFGDMVISSKNSESKDENVRNIEKVKKLAQNASIEQSMAIEREVLAAENLLEFLEKDISRRVKVAEALLKDIEMQGEFSKTDIQEIEKQIDLALGQLAAFSSEVKTLADTEEQFYNRLIEFKKKLHSLENTKNVTRELNLIEKIIKWVKSLFTNAKIKPHKPTRKKKNYDKQADVLFVGHGDFQQAKRALKRRPNEVRQHYLKRRKRL